MATHEVLRTASCYPEGAPAHKRFRKDFPPRHPFHNMKRGTRAASGHRAPTHGVRMAKPLALWKAPGASASSAW